MSGSVYGVGGGGGGEIAAEFFENNKPANKGDAYASLTTDPRFPKSTKSSEPATPTGFSFTCCLSNLVRPGLLVS